MIGTRILKIDSEIKRPFLVFTILSASIHPNCKSWGNFEKIRFAPILFAESTESTLNGPSLSTKAKNINFQCLKLP